MDPRTGIDDLQDELWTLFVRLARFALRGVPDGVGVEVARPGGQARGLKQGGRTVSITGEPLELLLWAYGRGAHAEVAFDGEPADVEAVRAAHLTI